MKVKRAFCFFEQSGTFKNEFKKLGVEAFDCDVLNNFNETDFSDDLFQAIEDAYENKPSIFDRIRAEEDIIMAFFPCTKFSARVPCNSRGQNFGMKDWNETQKLEYSRKLVKELAHNYDLICKMVIVALRKGIRMIIENPYTQPHFLTQYFPVAPKVIDKDRSERGDYYRKPTQFFFINCEPSNNLILDEDLKREKVSKISKVSVTLDGEMERGLSREEIRSMISPVYANRFIREYIL